MNFREYLSRKPVLGATPEENYDEQYIITILTVQVDMNFKYRTIFTDQSKRPDDNTKTRNDSTETKSEDEKIQSQTNGKFEIINNVNKTEQSKITTSGQSDSSTLHSSRTLENANNESMDRENFYHWGGAHLNLCKYSDAETILRIREDW